MKIITKYCSKCKDNKELDKFNKNISTKDGFQAICKKCQHDVYVIYKGDNKERVLENSRIVSRRWGENNPEKKKEVYRKWARNNPEKAAANSRKQGLKRQERYPDKLKKDKHNWYKQNRERVIKKSIKWRRNNKNKVLEYARTRRALKLVGGGKITDIEWQELLHEADNKCLRCGSQDRLTLDHVQPLAHGGRHEKENAQVLCHSCNCRKGVSHTDYRKQRADVRGKDSEK